LSLKHDQQHSVAGFFRAIALLLLSAIAALNTAGIALGGEPREPQPVRLETIGLTSDERGTLLTLSLSAPVSQHVFRLHNPERLVIDLPGARRLAALPQASPGGPVLAVRSGMHAPQQLRLVVELSGPVAARLQPSVEAARYRLQISFGTEHAAPRRSSVAKTMVASVPAVTSMPPPPVPPLPAPVAPSAAAPTHHVRVAHAPQGERDIVIAVDAGHGGEDPWRDRPQRNAREGCDPRDRALRWRPASLVSQGMHAVLTRDGDYLVPLRDRMQRARVPRMRICSCQFTPMR
jgi:N-acetylmuramoyl-L-alanine amidase